MINTQGDLAGIKNVAQLVRRLQQYFAPASTVVPPSADATNVGNRAVAINTDNYQTATLPLNAGKLIWKFSPAFTSPPTISALPVGSGAGLITLDGDPTVSQVVLQSSNGSDVRVLHLTASLTP